MNIELEDASGRRFIWGGDERSSEDRFQDLTFSTSKGDGFGTCSLTLIRRIDRDYPDLNLFDTLRCIAPDGSVAYEGRLTGNPRSIDDEGHKIQVEAVGWMAHARDKTFREVYVDRDISSITEMSRKRRIDLAAGTTMYHSFSQTQDETSAAPGITTDVQNIPVTFSGFAEALYDPGPGLTISRVICDAQQSANVANTHEAYVLNCDADDFSTAVENTADIVSSTGAATYGQQDFAPTTARRFIIFRYNTVTFAGSPGTTYTFAFRQISLFGSHGLTRQGSTFSQGFYASQVIENIAQRFCPKLSTAGVEDTTYVIQQCAYKDSTAPHDAFLDLNSFHNWELAVWEDKTLHFREPSALDDYDWEVRLDDEGTRVQLEGDSTERLANGVVVTYTDLVLGTTQTVTPDDDSTLADASENNPANIHGIDRWTPVEVPFPCQRADALQWGRTALAEFNSPSSPGRITVRGHIRDRQGNWQQAWKPKTGQRITISDHPNDRPRRITETSWNHESRTMEITVEQDARRLEVIGARVNHGRGAAGLG